MTDLSEYGIKSIQTVDVKLTTNRPNSKENGTRTIPITLPKLSFEISKGSK